jgi:sodium pump decarboxylase gamma subunit
MTVTELLAMFANPETIKSLSASDKMMAGLATTVLGMGITFSALIILLFVVSWMNRLLNPDRQKAEKLQEPPRKPQDTVEVTENTTENDDHEIVAAITTALALSLQTSVSKIVIRNIEVIDKHSHPWNRAGVVDQMNNRL